MQVVCTNVRLYLAIVVVVVFLEEERYSLQEQQALVVTLRSPLLAQMNNLQDHIDTRQCSRHHHNSNRLRHLLDWKNRSGSSNLPSQYAGTPSGMIQPSGTSGLAPVVQIKVGIVAPVGSDEQSPRSYWQSAVFRTSSQ